MIKITESQHRKLQMRAAFSMELQEEGDKGLEALRRGGHGVGVVTPHYFALQWRNAFAA